MKGKMKKIIAGIATLAMAAQFAFALPASAITDEEKAALTLGTGTEASPYVSYDFSGDTAGTKVKGSSKDPKYYPDYPNGDGVYNADSEDKWIGYYCGSTNRNAGNIAVQTDSTEGGRGNYAYVTAGQFADASTNNGRSPAITINKLPEVSSITTGNVVVLSFDFATTKPAGTIYVNDGTSHNPDKDFIAISLAKVTADKWYTAVVSVNLSTKLCTADIYDSNDEKVDSQSNTFTISGIPASLRFQGAGAVSNDCKYSVDNLKLYEKGASVVYNVKFNVSGVETTQYITSGENLPELPDTDKIGYVFKGWTTETGTGADVYDSSKTYITSDTLLATAVTANASYTAVYEKDNAYIEPIESVEITGPASMTFGADPDTAADNNYTLTITGEKGTVITSETVDSRISEFKIEWDIDGFKTGNDSTDQYCDSYGAFYNGSTPMSSANPGAVVAPTFKLRNVPMNFYGKMTAKITYKSNTGNAEYDVDQNLTATYYVTALGDTTTSTSQILPKAGYPSDYNTYPSSLVEYKSLSDTYGSKVDSLLGGVMSGSDGDGSAVVKEEDGNKFLRVSAPNQKKSHMYTYKIDAPATQAIFEQNVRYNNTGGSITLTSGYPFWSSNSGYSNPIALNFDGTHLVLNYVSAENPGATVSKDDNAVNVSTGTWYKVVLSVDKTTEQAYALLYDTAGNLLGETGNVAWMTSSNPTYYSVGFGSGTDTGTIDFDNYSAYYATADTSTFSIAATGPSLSTAKPEETIDLTASLKTAKGYEMTGAATWSVVEEDMADSVVITPDESDSHKVNVALTSDAVPGTATIQVNIGGYTKTQEIDITSSSASVKFTKSTSSISIPLEASKTSEAVYEADVVSGDGARINGTTLAIYDKNNANEYTLPDGITFDAATGKLTVTSAAPAVTFTVRATGVDNDNNKLTRAVKVTVHGLAFDFGAAADEPAEGYTAVTPSTSYSEKQGYGIASGSVTAGGTSSESDATGDYLSGAMTFKANVEKGHFYTVSIVYQGTLSTAYVNSDLAGYELGTNETLTTGEYTLPVVVDNIDLTVSGTDAKIASVTITKQADREPSAKPAIRHVGDSTAANSGAWAYYIDHNRSSFPELDAVATFYNNGAGGRNLCTYYTQGKLASVLRELKPGDIMMFGNNGTNGMGNSFEEDVNYYLDAAEALGAKIIINSYTPHGAVSGYASGYDAKTYTFDSYRKDSYDVIVRRVAEERAANDENYIGFVEIGKYADESFTAYVQDGADATEKAARAQEIISCFSDHNHYDKGSKARELMLNGYTPTTGDNAGTHIKGAVEQIVALLAADEPEPEAPKLAITAANKTDFTVKVGGVEKANGDELAVGDVITIAAADDAKEIVSATGFAVANGVATYTVQQGDKTVTISNVVVADKASDDFSVTFDSATTINGSTVTFAPTVTGTGTAVYNAYIAEYDGNALKSVKAQAITISNTTNTATISFDAAPTGTVKAFVWDQTTKAPVLTNTAVSAAVE